MADRRRRFMENRAAVAGGGVLALLVVFAGVGPLVWTYDHTIQRDIVSDTGPSLGHPFGTTRIGYDVLGQVMRGTAQSLRIGLVAGLIAASLGTAWGAVAGLRRGWVDVVLMRAVDVALTVPLLVVLLSVGRSVDGAQWFKLAVVIGLLGWLVTARVVRSLVVSMAEYDFIEAARAVGASEMRILVEHIGPNVAGAAVVAGSTTAAGAVLLEGALSFLGFGIAPPDTSLGLLVATSQGAAFTRPWLFFIPGALVVGLAASMSVVGDGLRDAVEPRH